MAEQAFDVLVIGGGPGGYVCAIRLAQLGFNTACVEKDATLGGTCVNVGCIPSKALLHASLKYHEAKDGLAALGVTVQGVKFDLPAMMGFKQKVVDSNTKGVDFLFKKNKITRLLGTAKLMGGGRVQIGADIVTAKFIVLATGSESIPLPGVKVDENRIVTSTGALALSGVPETMAVIGAGAIGLEMASVWARLGSKVTVIEYLDRILPGMDLEAAKQAQRILAKQGIAFKLSTKVTQATAEGNQVVISLAAAAGDGKPDGMTADVLLVAVGRRAFTAGLGLEAAGVKLDQRGRIEVDAHFATSAPGIYAIGDCIKGAMLAHKAEDEGVALAEMLAGQQPHINYDAIPAIVYTHPEVAVVGKTEEDLKAAGVAYKSGKFPFTANGRARAMNETEGFVKILADAASDRVLGVHIVGPEAGTMIAECVTAIEFGASAEDIARTCHAHPTLNEAIKEAALAVDGRAVHI